MYQIIYYQYYCHITDRSQYYNNGFADGYLIGLYSSFLTCVLFHIISMMIDRCNGNTKNQVEKDKAEEQEEVEEEEEEEEEQEEEKEEKTEEEKKDE